MPITGFFFDHWEPIRKAICSRIVCSIMLVPVIYATKHESAMLRSYCKQIIVLLEIQSLHFCPSYCHLTHKTDLLLSFVICLLIIVVQWKFHHLQIRPTCSQDETWSVLFHRFDTPQINFGYACDTYCVLEHASNEDNLPQAGVLISL